MENFGLQVEENTWRTVVYRLWKIQEELLKVERNTGRTRVYRLRRIQGEL